MLHQIILNNQTINYKQIISPKARHLRLTVSYDDGLVVTLPNNFSEEKAKKFMRQKARWILKKLTDAKKQPPSLLPKISHYDYKKYQFAAWELAHQKLDYYKKIYGLSFNRVSIKKQSTRWGSCSKKGNLNFNYRIIFLPPHLQDYLVVHELCHLLELNHSAKFWALVKKTIPDYLKRKKELHNL